MKYLIGLSTAAVLIAGIAQAQDATTRGGAESQMPSTKQNSPMTGTSTTPDSRQSGPATINNAPVGSSVQKEDQVKQAPRTGDSSKTIPTYR